MIPNYKYYIDKGLVKMISECTTIRSLHKEDTKAGIFKFDNGNAKLTSRSSPKPFLDHYCVHGFFRVSDM
jgi:hypothetical protein